MERLKKFAVVAAAWVAMLPLMAFINAGQFYDLTGEVDGKYPVTIYLVMNDDNVLDGKMFYHSTIVKNGVKPTSYLYLRGTYAEGQFALNVYDNDNKFVERWTGEFWTGNHGCQFNGTIFKPNGNRMTITADQVF